MDFFASLFLNCSKTDHQFNFLLENIKPAEKNSTGLKNLI